MNARNTFNRVALIVLTRFTRARLFRGRPNKAELDSHLGSINRQYLLALADIYLCAFLPAGGIFH